MTLTIPARVIFLFVGTGLPDGPCRSLALTDDFPVSVLTIKAVFFPSGRISINIRPYPLVISFISNHMVMGPILPYIAPILPVAKPLKSPNKLRHSRVLRRDRPPGRSVSSFHYPWQQMDMVGHNHILFKPYPVVKICHLLQLLSGNFSICCIIDSRTVREAGPYDVAQQLFLFFRAKCHEHVSRCIVIITF